MQLQRSLTTRASAIAGLVCIVGVYGSDGTNLAYGWGPRVRALSVLSTAVPVKSEKDRVVDVELQVTLDGGETFHPLGLGFPRPSDLFRASRYTEDSAFVSIAFAGNLQGDFGPSFPEVAGKYLFRWRIWLDNVNGPPVEVEQRIEFGKPAGADLQFIERVAEPRFLRRLFGKDPFDSYTSEAKNWVARPEAVDHRASLVIARLLEATRAKEPNAVIALGTSLENAVVWADSLWEIAQALPESSYAPYATYFAGCVYLSKAFADRQSWMKEQGMGERGLDDHKRDAIIAHIRDNADYSKADGVLRMAANSADEYLKPRVLYMLAMHRAGAFDLESAETMLDHATKAAPGRGTVQELVDYLRSEIARERSKTSRASPKEIP